MFPNRVRLALLSGVAAMAGAGSAHAQSGTAAGTQISNTASVSYTVNGTANTTSSNTASFVVDKKVNFTVALDQAGNTQVNLGQTGAYVKFKVTNTTNSTQDFWLDPDQAILSVGILTGSGDDFNITGMKAYVDSNGNGVYDAGVDTQEYIDELAPDASIAVFLVGDIPNTNGINQAQVSLHVLAAAGGTSGSKGALLIASDLSLLNSDTTVDIVFADDDSDGIANLGDVARNGQGRAYGAFDIGNRNVALTVTKSALVLSDGYSLVPKAIPGATVQYCLLVANGTLLTGANNVVLTDVIPNGTTYVAGSVSMGVPGGTCILAGTPIADSTAFNASTKTVSVNVGTVGGLGSVAVAFKVTIN
jgi:uncharacterized repeat protein (TIGR01451 family)